MILFECSFLRGCFEFCS